MNVDSDIKNRTFGIEIEMCNLERAKVTLPEGYSWSKEESIDNTDCSSNKQFGGEVNTPPLHLCCLKVLQGTITIILWKVFRVIVISTISATALI